MKILIDNGHGLNTPGKRSPDGTFLEATYNREIANQTLRQLQAKGHDAQLLVPEPEDIPLKERVRRVNAAGDGSQWMNATGWSCYTCKWQTESDLLADCLYTVADRILKKKVIRTDYARDGDRDWEENFYILRHSLYPAVLSENFFMDSHSDMEYLQSKAGKQAVVDTHVEGIVDYLNC